MARRCNESNAILNYIGKKSGKLLPTDRNGELVMQQLLFLQVSLQGPMFASTPIFNV
ncbi:MAG: hypothetical protein MO846_03420 [Candidatus Devosia symbiotica]|nr:hypothetical protein [Candidatus Devosia symbiotica]